VLKPCQVYDVLVVCRKQQKTRKVIETVNDELLTVAEDSSEQYMDVDLTEYSSSSQPVVPEQSSLSSEWQSLQNPAEVRPQNESADPSVDAADGVDLPEGLWWRSTLVNTTLATY